MEKDFLDAIKNKYDPDDTNGAINKVIDNFQKKFDCCGYNEWRDWRNSKYWNATELVPKSCCIKDTCSRNKNNPVPSDYYQQVRNTELKTKIIKHLC